MRRSCANKPGGCAADVRGASPRGQLQIVAGGAAAEEDPMAEQRSLEADLARDLDGSFERLVVEYQDRLYAFALRFCGNREDAEEVAQDAFVRAYGALRTYPAQRVRTLAMRPWLYQIVLNVARNRYRRKRHSTVSFEAASRGAEGEDPIPFEPPDRPEERPDRRFERRRERADIASLVAALPPRFREPLILRYVEGLPIAEVAAVLKQPLGTAKSNVHRAINVLRESLSRSRSARFGALEVR
ncbi:MAG: RNA polymerase sigma factor [Acidobacteriota bacterium]|nr:RNA polymerase sigma factor [Acidobacteriota bacterium]